MSPVPNARYNLVGTPEGHPLYQTPDITWLVHQKGVSCTDGVPLSIRYTERPSADDYDITDALRKNYAAALPSFRTPYMEFFLGLDLSASLSGITCPVMALNGTKDTQVQCDRNIAALEAGLPSNSRSVIRAEDGLNHLFQHCVTGEVSEYKNIEETFSPEVISRMISWLKAL